VRPDLVVVPPPSFDKHFSLLQRVEDFPVQQLIPELAVEALVEAVLPRAPGLDEERLHIDRVEPFTDRLGGELTPVVGSDVARGASVNEQLGQSIQHIVGSQMPGDVDRQALPGVLVDDRQHAGRLTVVCASHDEVVGPDVVRPSRPETDAGPVVEP
jgi:hypothetical protein